MPTVHINSQEQNADIRVIIYTAPAKGSLAWKATYTCKGLPGPSEAKLTVSLHGAEIDRVRATFSELIELKLPREAKSLQLEKGQQVSMVATCWNTSAKPDPDHPPTFAADFTYRDGDA